MPHDAFLEPLDALRGVHAGWCGRISGVNVDCDRNEAMQLLRPHHESWLAGQGRGVAELWRAEQVHGNEVAIVPGASQMLAPDGLPCVPKVDGLLTQSPHVTLAIYVADCGPIWLADPVRRVVGLLHSGKKGSEMDILGVAVEAMRDAFGTEPMDVVAVLGPCIRPPDYEVDFARMIASQAKNHGIGFFSDCEINTAANLEAYYSYRAELGKTGRMLATISLEA